MRCVITGGPGRGKTSLLKHLSKLGYRTGRELEREFMQEERAKPLEERRCLPEIDMAAFQSKMFGLKCREYETIVPADGEVVFFDRGMPDSIAYFRREGIAVPESTTSLCRRNRYDRIFILDALPEYVGDDERYEDEQHAQLTHDLVSRAYKSLGYGIIVVPPVPVPERAGIVLANI